MKLFDYFERTFFYKGALPVVVAMVLAIFLTLFLAFWSYTREIISLSLLDNTIKVMVTLGNMIAIDILIYSTLSMILVAINKSFFSAILKMSNPDIKKLIRIAIGLILGLNWSTVLLVFIAASVASAIAAAALLVWAILALTFCAIFFLPFITADLGAFFNKKIKNYYATK